VKPAAESVSSQRSESLRAAAQAAAERIRAAGPVTNTAADRLRETALRPARRSRAPLLAGVGLAIALAAGGGWYFWGSRGEAPVQAAGAPEPSALSGEHEPLPELAQLPGTSDADWAQIQGWTASAIDPSGEEAADAARARLLERGREAFPALIAALERLDLATESGAAAGERAHRILSEIARGKSLEWHSGSSPDAANANNETTRAWHAAWLAAREAPRAWAELTQTELAQAEALFERTGPPPP
jgi:hypothetical protein